MNINLHIERLVLDGIDLPRQQSPLLQRAVEGELGRLLAKGGLPALGMHINSLQAKELQLGASHEPLNLGTQIAQSVYSGIVK